MNWFESFFTISFMNLNLFSFMLGMLYTLSSISTFGNPRKLWLQMVFYMAAVAIYFYAKGQGVGVIQ